MWNRLRAFGLRWFSCWLLALGFLARFVCVLVLHNPHALPKPLAIRDAIEYNALALNLVKFGEYSIRIGHPSSFRAPGFPLWVAALYSISYDNRFLVYAGQCLLGALGCLLAYLLARELLPEVDARRSGLLAVVYMPAIFLCTLFFSDTLYADCVGLGMLLFVRYLRTKRSACLVIAGLALGYGALTRPAGILVLPALLAILIAAMIRERRFRWLPCLALTLSCCAVVAPWTWRNYVVHHQFVLIATNGGWTFYGSNNNIVLHNRRFLGRFAPPYLLQQRAVVNAMPEVSLDRLEWRLGIAWVRAHWASMPLRGDVQIPPAMVAVRTENPSVWLRRQQIRLNQGSWLSPISGSFPARLPPLRVRSQLLDLALVLIARYRPGPDCHRAGFQRRSALSGRPVHDLDALRRPRSNEKACDRQTCRRAILARMAWTRNGFTNP